MEITVGELKELLEQQDDDAKVFIKVGYDTKRNLELVDRGTDGYYYSNHITLVGY